MEAKGLRDNMAAHRDSVSKFCKKMEYLEIQAVADNSKEYGEWMISLLKLITYLFAEFDKTSKQYLRSIGYF